jgi:hypothetical protein
LSSKGLIGPFSFEGNVTGESYLTLLDGSILPAICELYGNVRFYYQQAGIPPHYHRNVRAYLDKNVSGHWIGLRDPIDFPPCSRDLRPLDFYLWVTVKNKVYRRRPNNLDILWDEIKTACAEIPLQTLVRVTEAVVVRTRDIIMLEAISFSIYYKCLAQKVH